MRGQKPLPQPTPKELRALGDHLRQRRLELGLLHREVAARLGVDKTTVYNWAARHKAGPSLPTGTGGVPWLYVLNVDARLTRGSLISRTSDKGKP